MSGSSPFLSESESCLTICQDRLQQWLVAFCVIRFDLEQGQVIEECYPSGSLTSDEELDVAFNSFPDSVSQHHSHSSIQDCLFFFRIRRRKNHETRDEFDRARNSSDEEGMRFLYGYVFNRQRYDGRLKRGGEHKSLVILSHNPFSSVFKPLLKAMGPSYFDIGKKAIEHFAAFISAWPAPSPCKRMELHIGSSMLEVIIPSYNDFSSDVKLLDEIAALIDRPVPSDQLISQGLFNDSDIFGSFKGILFQLWMLWELLIIGEPILIIGPSPSQCSEAVASLVSIVAPLHISVDFRPYFTIHDREFSYLNSLQEADTFPPMILGVTNLFFLRAFCKIPNIVSVGKPNKTSKVFISNGSFGPKSKGKWEGYGFQRFSLKQQQRSSLLNVVKFRRDGPLCLMTEHKEAIWSTYTAITKPDTSILNRLVDAGTSLRVEDYASIVNNEILGRHFFELTTNFLAPFGPYFRGTTPSEGSFYFLDPPPLPSFKADEFLASLSSRGAGKFLSKRLKSNWLDLYK